MSKEPGATFHKAADAYKIHVGIERLGAPVVVFQGKTGPRNRVDTRLELEYERWKGCTMARLRVVHRDGMSIKSSGYPLTISSLDNPVELKQMLARLLSAAEQSLSGNRREERRWYTRWMDWLTRSRTLANIPVFHEQREPYPDRVSAILRQQHDGIWATLVFDRGRHSPRTWLSIPLPALYALQHQLEQSASESVPIHSGAS